VEDAPFDGDGHGVEAVTVGDAVDLGRAVDDQLVVQVLPDPRQRHPRVRTSASSTGRATASTVPIVAPARASVPRNPMHAKSVDD
jgi:hypothetical protein